MTRTLEDLKLDLDNEYKLLFNNFKRVLVKEILQSELNLLNTRDKLENSLTDKLKKKLDELN